MRLVPWAQTTVVQSVILLSRLFSSVLDILKICAILLGYRTVHYLSESQNKAVRLCWMLTALAATQICLWKYRPKDSLRVL